MWQVVLMLIVLDVGGCAGVGCKDGSRELAKHVAGYGATYNHDHWALGRLTLMPGSSVDAVRDDLRSLLECGGADLERSSEAFPELRVKDVVALAYAQLAGLRFALPGGQGLRDAAIEDMLDE